MVLIQIDLSKRESNYINKIKKKLGMDSKKHAIKKLIVIADDMDLINKFISG